MNKTELKILEEVANGKDKIKGLPLSKAKIYRAIKNLDDFITHKRARLEPKKATHVNLLLQLLLKYPNLKSLLSDSGIIILTSTLSPKSIKEINKETNLKKSIIYRKINQAVKISAVKKEKQYYSINDKLWPGLIEFLSEFNKYKNTVDIRIPANSVIYHKKDNEIVFSNKVEQDASITAFSAYNNYGIKLLLPTNYYSLPKRKLSKKEIFIHSLYVTQKEKTIRHLIYVSLFYIKFKIQYTHPILSEIKSILKGKNIGGYPTLKEIKEKAELYDIRI